MPNLEVRLKSNLVLEGNNFQAYLLIKLEKITDTTSSINTQNTKKKKLKLAIQSYS